MTQRITTKIKNCAIDPLSPVRMVRLEAEGQSIDKCAVMLESPEFSNGIQVGIVSPDYKLIPNTDAVDVALRVIEKAGFIDSSKGTTAFNGRQFRQRWIFDNTIAEPIVGDTVSLGLDVVNSYDGTMKFGVRFIAQRLVCSNGMVVDFMLGGFSFRHWGENGQFTAETSDAVSYLIEASKTAPEKMIPALNRLTRTEIGVRQIKDIFTDLKVSPKMAGKVIMATECPKILSATKVDDPTMWDLYNGFTSVLSEKESVKNDGMNQMVSRYFLTGEKSTITMESEE